MSDQGNGTGQESSTETQRTGQESSADQNTGQGQEPGQGDQQGPPSLDSIQDPAVKAYLEALAKDTQEARQQAANYRTQLRAAQEQVDQFRQQNETAEQKAERERQERDERLKALEQENRDLKVGSTVREAASKALAHNPDTVYKMIKGSLEYDDQGQPVNVKALLDDLRKTDAYLFRRTSADAGGGQEGGSAPQQDMNSQIRAMAGRGQPT